MSSSIRSEPAGLLPDGRPVQRHILENSLGVRVSVLEYGAAVEQIWLPDGQGRVENVLVGPLTLEQRLKEPAPCGAVLGRVVGCIANAVFPLGGHLVHLPANDGPHHCDGGDEGLQRVLWSARMEETPEGPSLLLNHISPEGAGGYPGSLVVQARFQLTEENLFIAELMAVSDVVTVCNLAQKLRFDLSGSGTPAAVGEHVVEVLASLSLPLEQGLPVAPPQLVHGTAADMRLPARLETLLAPGEKGSHVSRLYVMPGCIEGPDLAARLRHPPSGRVVELYTSRPGLLVDLGPTGVQFMDMHLPDSPNRPLFPSVVLRPGTTYRHMAVYRFLQQ